MKRKENKHLPSQDGEACRFRMERRQSLIGWCAEAIEKSEAQTKGGGSG